MLKVKEYEFWFVTGSQNLYGPETLEQVAKHSKEIVAGLNENDFDYNIVFKPVVKTPDEIRQLCIDANSDPNCAGIITWMHTFSPAKMWISGLTELRKSLLHLHTQYNRDIPWDKIDMDFMNLNQAAHGDREYGFIGTRMKIGRKVVVGHWQDKKVINRIGSWVRTAVAYEESKTLKIARFGDNMREVAVTEGDKVEAQIQFGWSTSYFGIGDLVAKMNEFTNEDVEKLFEEYKEKYDIAEDENIDSIKYQAKIELGLKLSLKRVDLRHLRQTLKIYTVWSNFQG